MNTATVDIHLRTEAVKYQLCVKLNRVTGVGGKTNKSIFTEINNIVIPSNQYTFHTH